MKKGFKTLGNVVLWVCAVLTVVISINSYIKVKDSASVNINKYTQAVDELTEFKNTDFYALSEYSSDPSKLLDELMKYGTEDLASDYTPSAWSYMWFLQRLHNAALSAESNPESYEVVYEFAPTVSFFAHYIDSMIDFASTMIKLQSILISVARVVLGTLLVVIAIVVGKAVYTATKTKKEEPVLLTKEYEDAHEVSTSDEE